MNLDTTLIDEPRYSPTTMSMSEHTRSVQRKWRMSPKIAGCCLRRARPNISAGLPAIPPGMARRGLDTTGRNPPELGAMGAVTRARNGAGIGGDASRRSDRRTDEDRKASSGRFSSRFSSTCMNNLGRDAEPPRSPPRPSPTGRRRCHPRTAHGSSLFDPGRPEGALGRRAGRSSPRPHRGATARSGGQRKRAATRTRAQAPPLAPSTGSMASTGP